MYKRQGNYVGSNIAAIRDGSDSVITNFWNITTQRIVAQQLMNAIYGSIRTPSGFSTAYFAYYRLDTSRHPSVNLDGFIFPDDANLKQTTGALDVAPISGSGRSRSFAADFPGASRALLKVTAWRLYAGTSNSNAIPIAAGLVDADQQRRVPDSGTVSTSVTLTV